MIELGIGLLILRVAVGLVMMAHGAQKVFGAFGGPGRQGTQGFMTSLGLRPAGLWAAVGSWNELVGGALLLLGLLMPIGAIAVAAGMLLAVSLVHAKNGFWNSSGGFEFNAVIFGASVALLFTGPGRYSLDAALGLWLPTTVVVVLVVLALLGILVALLGRRTEPVKAA